MNTPDLNPFVPTRFELTVNIAATLASKILLELAEQFTPNIFYLIDHEKMLLNADCFSKEDKFSIRNAFAGTQLRMLLSARISSEYKSKQADELFKSLTVEPPFYLYKKASDKRHAHQAQEVINELTLIGEKHAKIIKESLIKVYENHITKHRNYFY